MRVLIAEDDWTSAVILRGFLKELGYDAVVVGDGLQAYEMIRREDFRIVISDWEMPAMDGLELCRRVRARNSGAYTYLILLTCRSGSDNLLEGLSAGADDFLVKPFEPQELRVRMQNAERVVQMEGRDLVIFALAKLAESRDPETGAHLERVREYVRILADELCRAGKYRDQIDADFVRLIYLTSPLHDIGKVGVPDQVLLKPGPLTASERSCMQQHAALGAQTLGAALAAHPSAEFLRMAQDIAWSHHERFDGDGYPRKLAGEDIPLCGRIMAVADVYDALTTRRVYKPAYSHDVARQIILEGSGAQFDPHVVEAFAVCEPEFVTISRRLANDVTTEGTDSACEVVGCTPTTSDELLERAAIS